MARVSKSVLVAHSPELLFALVDDVESYPRFLPWCSATHLRLRSTEETIATIDINYHGLKHSFTTRNRKTPPERMDITLQEGPFKRLEGHWIFNRLSDQACRIDFLLDYEFAGRLLERALSPVFNYIANSMVDAFVRRADALQPAK